jgi:pantoate kinase
MGKMGIPLLYRGLAKARYSQKWSKGPPFVSSIKRLKRDWLPAIWLFAGLIYTKLMTSNTSDDITDATARFEAALIRLEGALASSVSKVADLARRTGFDDGRKEALAEMAAQKGDVAPDLSPVLREELQAARAREAQLQEAVDAARAALDEAMDDIRKALGPI